MAQDPGYITVEFLLGGIGGDDPDVYQAIGVTVDFTDFAVNHADLPINHSAFLDAYAATLFNISGSKFDFEGTASLTGTADYNLALSRQRANSVATGLTSRGATQDQIRRIDANGSMDVAGTGELEAYQDRGVAMHVVCPPSAMDALTAFQTAWNSSQLKQQAAPPPPPIEFD